MTKALSTEALSTKSKYKHKTTATKTFISIHYQNQNKYYRRHQYKGLAKKNEYENRNECQKSGYHSFNIRVNKAHCHAIRYSSWILFVSIAERERHYLMQQPSLHNFLFDVLIILFQYSRTVKDSIAIVGITEALIIGKIFSMIRLQIIHSYILGIKI